MRRYPKQWACAVKKAAHERITSRRYRQSAKGQIATRRNNRRRIWIGRKALSHVATVELAEQINTYVRSAVRAFVHRQQEDSVLES